MIKLRYEYNRRGLGVNNSLPEVYTLSGLAMFVEPHQDMSRLLEVKEQSQSLHHGIDKVELSIPRSFIDEVTLESARRFHHHLVQISYEHVTGFVRFQRECFGEESSYLTVIRSVLWDCFKRGAFKIPVSVKNSRSGKEHHFPEYEISDNEVAFELILGKFRVHSMEVFFDQPYNVSGWVEDEMRRKSSQESQYAQATEPITLYSDDFTMRQYKSWGRRSTVKIYNKLACKAVKQQLPYQAEIDRPWRVEFTLNKQSLGRFRLDDLDHTKAEILNMVTPILTKNVDQHCPYIRRLVLEPSISEELKTVLLGRIMKRVRLKGRIPRSGNPLVGSIRGGK